MSAGTLSRMLPAPSAEASRPLAYPARASARWLDLAGLAAVWGLEVWLLRIWLAIDTRPQATDPTVFLRMTAAWRAFFLHPDQETLLQAATLFSWKTTPLWLIIMGLAQAVLGPDIDRTVWLSSTLALAILLLATYGIGRTLFSRFVGVCAAILVTLYSGVVIQTHLYYLDLPLTAMVALAAFGLARLLRPRVQRRDIVLAALLLGLACCTKYQAPFFLWLPALFVLGWRWRAERARGASPAQALRHVIVLAAAFGVGVLLVVGPFLAVNFAEFLRTLAVFSSPPGFESYGGRLPYDGAALTLYSLGWSVRTWFAFAWGDQWLLLVLPVVGALVVLVRLRAAAGLLLGWYLGAFWPLWHMIDKEPRYDLPLYPAFALLSVAPLALLERPLWSRVGRRATEVGVLLVLGLYGLGSLGWHAFGLSSPLQLLALPASAQQAPANGEENTPWWWPRVAWPAAENWQVEELFQILRRTRQALGLPRATVAVIPALRFFHSDAFIYQGLVADEPLLFYSGGWDPADGDSRAALWNADMIVSKTGLGGIPRFGTRGLTTFAADVADPRTELGYETAREFALLARRPLPDGSEALVYVRRSLLAPWSALRDWATARVEGDPLAVHPMTADDGSPGVVEIAAVPRRALLAPPPSHGGTTRISYPLRVPERARLQFGIGLVPDQSEDADQEVQSSPAAGVEFRIVVLQDQRLDELFRYTFDPQDRAEEHWVDAEIDLGRYAGQSVELRFETRAVGTPAAPVPTAVWSDPLLLPDA